MSRYAELHAYSNFTFLRGASHPEQLVVRAASLGYSALALTDLDGLYGIIRHMEAASIHNLSPLFGAEVTLEEGGTLTLLVKSRQGYRNLASLLTQGRLSRPKGQAALGRKSLEAHREGLFVLTGGYQGAIPQALLSGKRDAARSLLLELLELFGSGQVYLELTDHLLPSDVTLRQELLEMARLLDIPLVATQQAHYAEPTDRPLQDVLTCIRTHLPLAEAATHLLPNGDFYLHPIEELEHRFRAIPEALKNTLRIAERCEFSLNELDFELPDFPVPSQFQSGLEYLEHLTFLNAPSRFPEVNAKVIAQLRHELSVIGRHHLEGYFLIVWDIVRFCHEEGILVQGRGSAANSAVCFSLGITNVDPIRHSLLFERFLSEGRKDAPDIDLDIANDRREEVIQYVYKRYGRDHAGMVCEVITYRARSAVREVGKALGLSIEQVDRISKGLEGRRFSVGVVSDSGLGSDAGARIAPPRDNEASPLPAAQQAPPPIDPKNAPTGAPTGAPTPEASSSSETEKAPKTDALSPEEHRIADHLWSLCRQIEGFPRHLGIHVGGMIICRSPLGSLVPIENATMPGRTVVQWDKDDVGALKMAKIDLLGLGMLSLIGEAIRLVKKHEGIDVDPSKLSYADPAIYDLIARADTVGVFQVESRAQMNVLPRLRPRVFYDLVVEVALIRPGPIQGDMVHPYLRRRSGEEPVTYLHPDLEPILKRTLGVPLFQEQGMKVAITAAGFTPAEADTLRRAMSSKRSRATMDHLTRRLLEGMVQRGYQEDIARRIVSQIEAFADYGFPESHAASFALLVYVSAYLKHSHPQAFYAALLNNQPMGFYSSATIVRDALRHGVRTLPVDVLRSDWDWTLEGKALRAGLCSVRGLGDTHKAAFLDARARSPFRSVDDFCIRTGWPKLILERLAGAGAMAGFGLKRRDALWHVQGFRERPGLAAPEAREPEVSLIPATKAEALVLDMSALGHSPADHPLQFLRPLLEKWKVCPSQQLPRCKSGETVRVAGVVTVRQRPPTAAGFCFLTLEDEGGMMNIVIRPDIYETYRLQVRQAMIVLVEGTVQRSKGVTNVMAEKIARLDEHWAKGLKSRDFH